MGHNQSAGKRLPQFGRSSALMEASLDDFASFPLTPQAVNLTFVLLQNYFSDAGPAIITQSDPLSVNVVPVVSGSQAGNYQPISIGKVVSTFGVNVSNSTEIDGIFSGTQFFSRQTPPGDGSFGTADGWGNLGRLAMPLELLVAPRSGTLAGKTYYVVAGGDIQIAASSTKMLWSMICRLSQGGSHRNTWLRADTIVNGSSVSALFSNQNPLVESQIQLSLGLSATGFIPSGTLQTRLMQFEIQEI